MASIFTYEPDPPRVDSPWLRGSTRSQNGGRDAAERIDVAKDVARPVSDQRDPIITQLEAEPQEGPVEYKLHLLLRPRRRFIYTSTGTRVPGSKHSDTGDDHDIHHSVSTAPPVVEFENLSGLATPSSATTYQSRQHRLQQLTTQLLWRLQQSSPHHASSATNVILPSLPEPLPELQAPQSPAKLLHGLEESLGALYEIGVADDGTLVGLAEDEMHESLNNLRAMSACLGCTVEILRRHVVGNCEWSVLNFDDGGERGESHVGQLFVVEALVKPYLHPTSFDETATLPSPLRSAATESIKNTRLASDHVTEQLRVTLTGPTMSGKSSLLGTLTTSTLDNGRGKSRISMLKHRHEISSGVTSSVTQELIGYAEENDGNAAVINYAAANVASWIDIHVAVDGGRLVFISDSAGHPRYRRTTIRGLVGCAPHWTLLCIPADDTEITAGKTGSTHGAQQQTGSAVADMDLSGAQLELCLRLGLPLVIVITKLDLASKAGLKETLTKVLDALKGAGRKPAILANPAGHISEFDLQSIQSSMIDNVYDAVLPLLNDPRAYVPIVLTSALHGTGVNNLHALLHELPVPNLNDTVDSDGNLVFHIEDIYNRPLEEGGIIISGRVRSGRVSVDDIATIGPFSTHELEDSEDSDERSHRRSSVKLPTSRSFPGALPSEIMAKSHFHIPNQEWRRVKITSIRKLRLPVRSLLGDQIGTIAIAADVNEREIATAGTTGFGGLRKGMVLTSIQPLAVRTFVARFSRDDLGSLAVGNHVVVYIASVRASARIVSARAPDSPGDDERRKLNPRKESMGDETFDLDDLHHAIVEAEEEQGLDTRVAGRITTDTLLVTLTFATSKEFVMRGDQVLVMPGGGPSLYGGQERGEKGVAALEGFVGRIEETYG